MLLFSAATMQAGSATWSLHPASSDWNTVANWSPATVPNAPSDTATFGTTTIPDLTLSAATIVAGITYSLGGSAIATTVPAPFGLTFSGVGITNSSGQMQVFQTSVGEDARKAVISFNSNATAGDLTTFINLSPISQQVIGGLLAFNDSSSAGHASVINQGSGNGVFGGQTEFHNQATAGEATFTCLPGALNGGMTIFEDSSTAGSAHFTAEGGSLLYGGEVNFVDSASADHGTYSANGGATSGARGGTMEFDNSATVSQGVFTINGGTVAGAEGGVVSLYDQTTAGAANFVINAGTVAGAGGGYLTVSGKALLGSATITLNGGPGTGGSCGFGLTPDGGNARFRIYGNGTLSMVLNNSTPLTVGSIEGDGLISIGGYNVLAAGNNNLDTTFSGTISNLGSLQKIGSRTLTLSGANIYTGTTTVIAGTLVADNSTGSATGTGKVQVDAGTLGGGGIIVGTVVVGTGSGAGAVLAPAHRTRKKSKLTLLKSLTLQADGTYTYTFQARRNQARADEVIANGVTINSGATIKIKGQVKGALRPGLTLTVLSNTSSNSIAGAFANLPGGTIVTVNGNDLLASYTGGDGNDLTLTVVR